MIYYAPQNRLGTAQNLFHFAFSQFNRATCIRKLDQLEELIVENGKTTEIMDESKLNELRPFIFDGLIDSIRIIVCYENFIKALLLINGYIVNVIDSNHSKQFHKNQKKRPLLLKDYCSQFPFKKDDKLDLDIIPGLTNRTLSFEIITSQQYIDLLQIPKGRITTVKKLYQKRNEIHFYVEEHFQYGKAQIDDLKELKVYTNKILEQNNNNVAKALNAPDHHYIDLK